jgi:hypothetical protein
VSIPAWLGTIAGMLLVTLGGLWLAWRLVRRPKLDMRDVNEALREVYKDVPRDVLFPEHPLLRRFDDEALRVANPLASEVYRRRDDGGVERWDGTRWVEHIEDLPTPNERPRGRR